MDQSKSTPSGSDPASEDSSVVRKPVRILVTGDRNWFCPALASKILRRLASTYGKDNLTIVHGGCRGVDVAFGNACQQERIKTEVHPAEWGSLGARAGPIRNQRMVDRGAKLCLVFHKDIAKSKGTKDCATRAMEAGISTFLIADDPDVVHAVRLRTVGQFDQYQTFMDLGD